MNDPLLEWWNKPDLFVNVTSMCMNKLEVKFEIGQHPNIKIELSIKHFLESLKENDLNTLIMFCEKRLKCL